MTSHHIATALAVLGASLTFAAPASAQTAPKWSGSIGVETQYQDYQEPSVSVEEDGFFAGVTGEAQVESDLGILRADIRYALGSMDYSGSGKINDIDDSVFEGRIVIGHAIPFGYNGAHRLVPYVGYGYRRLMDDLGGRVSTTGARGYDRVSQYHYVPMGLEAVINSSEGWAFKPTLEYDYLIAGRQESKLSQVFSGVSDLNNKQDSGYGLRASLMAETKLGAMPVAFGPYVRYWNIDRSDTAPITFSGVTVANGYEPANETVELGVALKFGF